MRRYIYRVIYKQSNIYIKDYIYEKNILIKKKNIYIKEDIQKWLYI